MTEQFLSAFHLVSLTVAFGAVLFAVYVAAATKPKSRTRGIDMAIPLFGNELRMKYRRRFSYEESKGQVPAVMLGSLIVSFWSQSAIVRAAKFAE